jgi:hypothetical protein
MSQRIPILLVFIDTILDCTIISSEFRFRLLASPEITKDVVFLDGEIEPLAVGIMDGILKFLETILPSRFVIRMSFFPVFIFLSASSGLDLALCVIAWPGNDEVLIRLIGQESDHLEILHLESDEDGQAEESQVACSGHEEFGVFFLADDLPVSLVVDELDSIDVVGDGLGLDACSVAACSEGTADIDLDHNSIGFIL